MKLKLKLTAIIAIMMFLVIAAISVILLSRASALQVGAAEANLENMTGLHATELESQYQVYLDVVTSLSQIMNGYRSVDPMTRRGRYTEMLQAIMESRPNFVGIYTVWIPGSIDNRNAELANTPGTDGNGNFIAWIARDTGSLELRAYTDWQKALKEVKPIPTIGDPVRRTIAGKETLVVNITVPIIPEGTTDIVGLIGVNFDLELSQTIVEKLKPYETGRMILISTNGTVVAHYDPTKVGLTAQEVLSPVVGQAGVDRSLEAIKTGEPIFFSSNGRICDSYPFYVGEIATPWALLSSVESSTVLAAVSTLTQFTIILAVVTVIVTGVIVFFIASNITNPIVKVSLTLKDISEGEGDLTKSITLKSKDEVGDLARYFNQTLEKIKNLVIIIKQQAVALFDIGNELASNMTETAAAINQITANIQSIKGRVLNQSASVTETNSTMEQI
ncbi:MAG: methyl-accepting chemotaxis protein, partial [Spirochaetaceae bacterium]|nr:methyl-accepting chemotaxis protein [Spirochaetaceae bacterium]